MESSLLAEFPLELVHNILFLSHPLDVLSFSMGCRTTYSSIVNDPDQYLWRKLFLIHFDDPRQPNVRPGRMPVHWKHELLDRMKAERVAFNADNELSSVRAKALKTLVLVAQDALPCSTETTAESRNISWLKEVTHTSNILQITPSELEANSLARLRTYCIDDNVVQNLSSFFNRTKSRCFVYDLRNYHRDNWWGPFNTDGEVNWVHIECIMDVVLENVQELPGFWCHARPSIGLEAIRPCSAPVGDSTFDWAGVEGTWRRYISFMDYRDLYEFNFSSTSDGPRNPSFFEDQQFREATRLIELKLRLISREKFRHIEPSDLEDLEPTQYPPLCFSGTSRGVNGTEALIEGYVRLSARGYTLWQFVSIYDGHPLWGSTGVQVGNIRSSIGVVGTWTTTTHGEGDPVGPFWLWKVEEDLAVPLLEYV